MAEVEGGLHPVLDNVHSLQDAVYMDGLGDALEHGRIGGGRLWGEFTPWQDANPTYVVSTLTVIDTQSRISAAFAFPPPQECGNPMFVLELDDDNPEEDKVIPILAQLLIKSEAPMTIIDAGSRRVPIKEVMLHLTADTSILVFDDSTQLAPFKGPYDGSRYRSIGNFLNKFSPLPQLLQFVREQA